MKLKFTPVRLDVDKIPDAAIVEINGAWKLYTDFDAATFVTLPSWFLLRSKQKPHRFVFANCDNTDYDNPYPPMWEEYSPD